MSQTSSSSRPEKNTSGVAFASRAMLDILFSGLQARHPDSPVLVHRSQGEATIPISAKREFLQQVIHHHGLNALPALGLGVSQHTDTPISHALLNSNAPDTLLKKWQRLERYVHARHYTEFEWVTPESTLKLFHRSRSGQLPTLAEDLCVMGVLCALFAQIGLKQVRLYHCSDTDQPVFDTDSGRSETRRCTDQNSQAGAHWYIRWQIEEEGKDEAQKSKERQTGVQPDQAGPASRVSSASWEQQVHQAVESLGLLACSLDDVAQALHVSPRSLQRYLAREELKFARLIQDIRVQHAARQLSQKPACLAEIGFVCGFSDQAHFTRVFAQWNGMTPKAFMKVSAIS